MVEKTSKLKNFEAIPKLHSGVTGVNTCIYFLLIFSVSIVTLGYNHIINIILRVLPNCNVSTYILPRSLPRNYLFIWGKRPSLLGPSCVMGILCINLLCIQNNLTGRYCYLHIMSLDSQHSRKGREIMQDQAASPSILLPQSQWSPCSSWVVGFTSIIYPIFRLFCFDRFSLCFPVHPRVASNVWQPLHLSLLRDEITCMHHIPSSQV